MSKRGENIRKRKDGRWEARYIVDRDCFGKAIYRSIYGKTYAEAKEKLNIEREKKQKEKNSECCILLTNLLDKWLLNNAVRYKQATYSKYKYMIDKHIVPFIGEMQIKNVSASTVNTFLENKLKNGGLGNKNELSPSYVRTMALIINSALKYAVTEGMCSPIKSEIFKPSVRQSNILTLNHNEYNILSQYCRDHLNHISLGILIALSTGLRLGEICALKWDDIDLNSHLIHVNNTVSRIKDDKYKCKWIIEVPKTPASLRVVPISDSLINSILKIKELSVSNYIVSQNESFINPRTFEYRYHKELCASTVRDINFHALRHTFATRCMEGGMDVKSLSEILGHSNVNITLNTYVHSSMELKKIQIEKVEEYFDCGQE